MRKKLFAIGLVVFLIAMTAIPAIAQDGEPKAPPRTRVHGKSNVGHLLLVKKTQDPWNPIWPEAFGVLKYNRWGPEFEYHFNGHKLQPDTDYSLIYYPEPQTTWPWPVTVIDSGMSDLDGNIHLKDSFNFNMDLNDDKIWLVLSGDIVEGSLSGWNPDAYLFEYDLISYNDTDWPPITTTS